jgi:hypothetical protein
MQKTQLAHLLIDIDAFVFNQQTEAWLQQANFHRCYLTFDPRHKTVTVQKWGASRRPSGTAELLWLGLDLDENKSLLQAKIITHLTSWDRIYGDVHFSVADSEPLPAPLPFSKAAVPLKAVENLFLANSR